MSLITNLKPMEEKINKLELQVKMMTEVIMAIILVQDMYAQLRLRKAYPALDAMMKKSWL